NKIKNITGSVTASTLVIGILFSLLLSYRNSTPIHKILDSFKESMEGAEGKNKNIYDFLQGNISSLISHHQSMEEKLERQKPLLRDAFIRRLVKGELQSQAEIHALLSQIDLRLGGNRGFAGLIQ